MHVHEWRIKDWAVTVAAASPLPRLRRARAAVAGLAGDETASRAFRHGLWLAGAFTVAIAITEAIRGNVGGDAAAYYSVWARHGSPYTSSPETPGAYLYSPAFAQAIWPLTQLPWRVFCGLWLGLSGLVYAWLLAPLPLRWRGPLLLLALGLGAGGNIWPLFALVIVFGCRRPSLWAIPALTKITPCLGPIWFAARKEWRQLSVALGAILAITAVSAVIAPHLWFDWFRFLAAPHRAGKLAPPVEIPTRVLLPIELPIAVGITVLAARRNAPWLLPIAVLFAQPLLYGQSVLILAAIPRLGASRNHQITARMLPLRRRPRLSAASLRSLSG